MPLEFFTKLESYKGVINMSEILYKLEQITESFSEESPIPERSLVFTGPNYPHKVTFPKDRTTLFFQGKLYDWYGHKVALSDDIAKILKPFGYSYDSQDQFLVMTDDHRYALATLHYEKNR